MKQLTLQDKFHALSPGTRAAALVIFILSLAAYSGSFHAGFHFDDINQILENRHVRDIGNVPRFFADAALASGIPGRIGYRPVTFSTYAVNYAIGGYGVSGFHIVNFMLHVLNALMVFLVTGAVLKKTGADSPGLPLASALIFALHPVQTSAVTYVSGRSALLASLFCLLSLYSFIRLREAGARPARYAWWAASLAFFVLGLLSKEMAVSALGLMAAYQVIVEGPEKAGDRGPGPVLYIPYAAVLALYVYLKINTQGFLSPAGLDYGRYEYILSQAKALLLYLRLLFLPVNQNSDYYLSVTRHLDFRALLGAASAVLAVAVLYGLRKKVRDVSFFGIWFFICLAPESSLFPIDDIAVEHRLYLPSAGFIAAAVLSAARLLRTRRARTAAVFAVVLCLVPLTLSRNAVWADDYSLWSDVAVKAPASPRAHANLGMALAKRREYDRALGELYRALEIEPDYTWRARVYNNIGACMRKTGKNAEAVSFFKKAIQAEPALLDAYLNLAEIYREMGNFEERIRVLKAAQGLDPRL